MRRVVRRLALVCVLAGPLAAVAYAADVLSTLAILPQAAKEAVDTVLSSGVFNPGLPAGTFKLLPAAARAEMATAGIAWLKSHTASAEFKRQYAQVRETHKPTPPEFEGTPEDELKKALDEQKQQAEESKKAFAALTPEQRQQLEEAMTAAAAIVAQMDTPEMRQMRLDGITAVRLDRTTQYQQELANQ